jgi:hypothetical protein
MAEYPQILAANELERAVVSFTSGAGQPLAEDPVYRLAHLADRSRLSMWRGAVPGPAEQRVVWTFPSPAACDTFVLDRNFVLNPGAALYLDWSGSSDFSVFGTVVSLLSPDSLSIHWCAFPAVTAGFWRMRLCGLTVAPRIFNLWLGRRIELAFGPSRDFDPHEEELVGEPVHGASGGFQWTQRYRRRVLRAGFENLTDSQYAQIDRWWAQAGRDGRNWWWLTFPVSEPGDPLYLNCEGGARRFAFNNAVRSGSIEAWEVR